MKITWYRDSHRMAYLDKVIDVVCDVRNEINGRRALSEKPVYSENKDGGDGVAYMPRPFPLGEWTIEAVLDKTTDYEAPEFIATDAHQKVEEWAITYNKDGTPCYDHATGNFVEDYGYGFHNSSSPTTLGCGRVLGALDGVTKFSTAERAALVAAIQEAWKNGETVTVLVA